MNEQLRELYQELIMDHNKNPRNHDVLSDADASAQGFNPLCGDKLTLYCKFKGDVIEALTFKGSGCAISQASASLMTEALKGLTKASALALFHDFHEMMTKDKSVTLPDKIAVLEGVKAFPARVKCATLAWHTFDALVKQQEIVVSTE